jgi:ribosomal protein S18 acetylase RimI-like enzyme
MKSADLAFAAACTTAEGWADEDLDTLLGFHLHDARGCFIARLDGQAAGMSIATSYGTTGFIGELIVIPEARGRGIGAALIKYSVDYLHQRGAQTIYLDGMLKAVPLYERSGFRRICRSLRFSGRLAGKQHNEVRPMQAEDLPEVNDLDRQAFAAERSFFLKRRFKIHPELAKVLVNDGNIAGFILGRKGEGWLAAGPWVAAECEKDPVKLLETFAYETGGISLSLGVLECNQPAVKLLRSLGFAERVDNPWRMACGPLSGLGMSSGCYALGSAAKG